MSEDLAARALKACEQAYIWASPIHKGRPIRELVIEDARAVGKEVWDAAHPKDLPGMPNAWRPEED